MFQKIASTLIILCLIPLAPVNSEAAVVSSALRALEVIHTSNILIDTAESVSLPAYSAIGVAIVLERTFSTSQIVLKLTPHVINAGVWTSQVATTGLVIGVVIAYLQGKPAVATTLTEHYQTATGFAEFLKLPQDLQLQYMMMDEGLYNLVIQTADKAEQLQHLSK